MTGGTAWRYCPQCANALAFITQDEDGGPKERLRCAHCGFTHWNNPTPVLAAVVECADQGGQVLLARNAAWPGRMFALITGFMEAGETPEAGVAREVLEETALAVDSVELIGVWDFQRMNQVIIAYHLVATGTIALNQELDDYKHVPFERCRVWPGGTGLALRDWLRSRGYEPEMIQMK